MGNMTPILFLNDCADQIEKNPKQVVQNILAAMDNTSEKTKTFPVGNCGNPMQSMSTQHADVRRLFLAYGNSMIGFGWDSDIENLEDRKRYLMMAKNLLKYEEQEIKRLEKKVNDSAELASETYSR